MKLSWIIAFTMLGIGYLSMELGAHTQNQIVEQQAIETQETRRRPTRVVTATASPTPDRRATKTPMPEGSVTITVTQTPTPTPTQRTR